MKKKGMNITVGIFIGLVAGVIVGIVMPEWLNTVLTVIATIYMSALKMMIFPLVFTSLVMGIIGIGDIAKTGKNRASCDLLVYRNDDFGLWTWSSFT